MTLSVLPLSNIVQFGGFSAVCTFPNTQPSTPEQVVEANTPTSEKLNNYDCIDFHITKFQSKLGVIFYQKIVACEQTLSLKYQVIKLGTVVDVKTSCCAESFNS